MVENGGFSVCEAANATQALAVLESRDDVGVLFTDIDMPGDIDGLDLARIVHKRWAHIGIIIVSGHARLEVGEIPDGGVLLSKPYLRTTILPALHDADGLLHLPTTSVPI